MVASKIDFVGRTLADRYEVLAPLGEGNMGLVYTAYDHNLGSKVVIKVPSEESLRDPEFVQRFEVETQSMVRLTHPHVVGILQQGTHAEGGDIVPYVVMQYLEGGSLKDRATDPDGERIPMAPGSLEDWLLEVAKALDFMHGQQFIHRDVKPANILFDAHGNPYLSDFGLAKVLEAREEQQSENSLTAAGFLVGTPNYVAPELVMGKKATAACDQYSLGITVYEVLTGTCPMEGPTASATMVNQTTRSAPPPHTVVRSVPPALSKIVLKALAKSPGDRFENCVDFAKAALASLTGPAVPSRGPSPTRRRSRPTPARRQPVTEPEYDEYEEDDWGTGPAPKLPPRTGGKRSGGRSSAKKDRKGVSRGRRGRVKCPSCGRMLPLKEEHAGRRGRCIHCDAHLEIGNDLQSLRLLTGSSANRLRTRGVPPKTRSGDTSRGGSDGTSRHSRPEDELIIGERVFGLDLSRRAAVALFGVLLAVILAVSIFIGAYLEHDPEKAARDEANKVRANE